MSRDWLRTNLDWHFFSHNSLPRLRLKSWRDGAIKGRNQNKQKYSSQSEKWLRTLVWKTKTKHHNNRLSLSLSTFLLPCLFFLPLPIVVIIIVMSHCHTVGHTITADVVWSARLTSSYWERPDNTETFYSWLPLASLITRRDKLLFLSLSSLPELRSTLVYVNCQYWEINRIDLIISWETLQQLRGFSLFSCHNYPRTVHCTYPEPQDKVW